MKRTPRKINHCQIHKLNVPADHKLAKHNGKKVYYEGQTKTRVFIRILKDERYMTHTVYRVLPSQITNFPFNDFC